MVCASVTEREDVRAVARKQHVDGERGEEKCENGREMSLKSDVETHCVNDGGVALVDGKENYDVIVVGAGVAGAALAYSLGMRGRSVLCIERDLSEPDRIVGELLQPGGVLALRSLGLETCVDGIDAQKVHGYAMYMDGKESKVEYPTDDIFIRSRRRNADAVSGGESNSGEQNESSQQEDVEIAGRSFHNGRFVMRLREEARKVKNVNLIEGTVTSLLDKEGSKHDDKSDKPVGGVRFRVTLKNQKLEENSTSNTVDANDNLKAKKTRDVDVFAPLTIVCDGMFSSLRKTLSTAKIENTSHFVGVIVKNAKLPHSNFGHVVLAKPSPILLYPIASNEVRVLVDIPGSKIPSISNGAMTEYMRETVAPQLPDCMREAFLVAIKNERIRSMTNKSMPAQPRPIRGALLLGDSFNMRHPLTGGGMTVALSDVSVLVRMLDELPELSDVDATAKHTHTFYTARKPVAATINTLANALYKVFCASDDDAHEEMRKACFDYLNSGGWCSSGPVALLSGLNPTPLHLVGHFFAVALFGIKRLLSPFPTMSSMWMGFRLLAGASGIIAPILLNEGIRQVFLPDLMVGGSKRKRYPPPVMMESLDSMEGKEMVMEEGEKDELCKRVKKRTKKCALDKK